MGKRLLCSVTGLALLTIFALPQTSMAGTDKSADVNTAPSTTTSKKAMLFKQEVLDAKSGAGGPGGKKGEMGSAGTSANEIRDWAAIDTNKDHYIQPEEMEKYLSDAWAAQKKAGTKAK